MKLLFAFSMYAAAGPAFCHAGHDADHLAWVWEPWVLLPLVLACGMYGLGWLRLRREGKAPRVLGVLRPLSFAGGIGALFLALVSPLDTLAERLFSAHMTQHLLLMLVAPPLLAWSRPVFVGLWAFPLQQRRRIGRAWNGTHVLHATYAFLMRPLVAWLLASVALWFWHVPGPYEWALADEHIHALEHLCFFLTSLAFWTLTMRPRGYGVALVMVATFALHNGLLGALLTFAAQPFYHAHHPYAFGLSPLEDQQLAGLIMWVPASVVHLVALALLFAAWLAAAGTQDRTAGARLASPGVKNLGGGYDVT